MSLELEEARAMFINELRGKTPDEVVDQLKHVMLMVLDYIPAPSESADRIEMAVHIFERERPQPSNEFDDETCECCGPYGKRPSAKKAR